MQKIEDMGVARNTLVIFTSDNGGVAHSNPNWGTITNNAPFRSGKGSLYEGGIRVPLLIRSPQIAHSGQTCDALVTTHDFVPTICDLLNIKASPSDGVSLAPLLRDVNAPWQRNTLYWHFPHYYPTTSPVSAIRAGPYKLLHFYEDNHSELYHLTRDPGELHDLAKQEAGQSQELHSRLSQWLSEMGGQLPVKNPSR